MLESSSDWTTREWIERAVINQYVRLESEKSEADAEALAMARGPNRNSNPAVTCMFCSRAGHTAATCRQYRLVKRDPNENGRRGNGSGNTSNTKDNGRHGGGGGSGRGSGGCRNRAASKTSKTGASPDDDKKTVRSGCYICEGPHKAWDCPKTRSSATLTSAAATSTSAASPMLGGVRRPEDRIQPGSRTAREPGNGQCTGGCGFWAADQSAGRRRILGQL